MKAILATMILLSSAAYAVNPSANTKTFAQACKATNKSDTASLAARAYCVGYLAGIADTAPDVALRGAGTYSDALDMVVNWIHSQETNHSPVHDVMPIDSLWVGDAIHEALRTLYPEPSINRR